MIIFKCKMCGGALEINNNETVATCEYCGTQQTLPKLDDDKRANMYDRANHFRRNNEFDKAMGIYEQILNEDNTDAEAYWSIVLCRYGIEYVEDPSSRKRIPTVNRAQFTSIFDDDNYKSALQYADGYQKSVYEEEAKAINEIQKGILAISQKEEPFDVFICYKETDNNGRRTPDSVLATELYHELTKEGFKVFFARITLEDKLGTAYEPYIFAALNSSKVMVALGTKPEYFNAVWVKNEWSRYLSLIKNGAKKILIPAYRDMDPYDLPEEFSHLQAQDMSKLGFMQDLIRGIKKIAQAEAPKTTMVKETVIAGGNGNTAPLLKRAFMFLEDGDWSSANEYCEKVLDIDPENASAYLGKLLSELRVRKQESLKDQAEPFDGNNNYQKAIRFADEKLKSTLIGYIEYINTRNENTRLDGIYSNAKNTMAAASSESAYKEAARLFETISEHLDSATLAQTCYEKAEVARKDTILSEGNAKMTGDAISNYESASKLFESISGWKDADEKFHACQKKIEEIKAKAEADRLERERQAEIARKEAEKRAKLNKKIAIITTPIVCVLIAFVIVWNIVIIPNGKYNDAVKAMNEGNIIEAYETFVSLDDYKDSAEKAASLYAKYEMEKIKLADVGDYIHFGTYEQDNDTSNGKEDVEWIVLAKEGDKTLIISRYALDSQPYNTTVNDVTWETCSLRKWLNDTFINNAFSSDEQDMIITTIVSGDKNSEDNNSGAVTHDKVFLLSIDEVNQYIKDRERTCRATDYVVACGDDQGAVYGNHSCMWWLRSLEGYPNHASMVDYNGEFYEFSVQATSNGSGVRPAMWVTHLSSDERYSDAIALLETGKYEEAIKEFVSLGGYKDSDDMISECNTAILDGRYEDALALMEAGKYSEAISAFEAISEYRDSAEKINECNYNVAVDLMEQGQYENAYLTFISITQYRDSQDQAVACAGLVAKEAEDVRDWKHALQWYDICEDSDGANRVMYEYVKENYDNTDLDTYSYLKELINANYKDAQSLYGTLYHQKFTILVNTDYKDKTTNQTSINVNSQYDDIYVHVLYSGGTPEQKTINASATIEYYKSGNWKEWSHCYIDSLTSGQWAIESFLSLGYSSFRFVLNNSDTGETIATIPINVY